MLAQQGTIELRLGVIAHQTELLVHMLINGIPQTNLAATDRAVSFGDGIFTTFRIIAGQVQHLEAHLNRLKAGCNALALREVDWQALESEMKQVANRADSPLAVGKSIISRGQGGRGYSPDGVGQATRIVGAFAFPSHVETWRQQGISLVQGKLKLAIQPLLAGHKTLNRLEQVLAKQELIEQGAVEGVFCDTQGYVVECNAANLFWRKGDRLYTPNLSQSGVAGVMRAQVMAYCEKHHAQVEEVQALPATLEEADELFLCNSILGPIPVTHLDTKHYDSHFMCRLLQKELDPLSFESGSLS